MTKREAKRILIKAATNDIVGSGLGMRNTTDEWRKKVTEAIKIVWKEVEGREMSDAEMFNNRLY